MSIDLGSPVPRWRQLANLLRAQIERGELTGRIPGEKHLMQHYGLAQGTVRHALAQLRSEGLITTTPGLGSYVTGTVPDRPDDGGRNGFLQQDTPPG